MCLKERDDPAVASGVYLAKSEERAGRMKRPVIEAVHRPRGSFGREQMLPFRHRLAGPL
jgi:hypothetical protein